MSTPILTPRWQPRLALALTATGAAVIAWEPANWLLRTWYAPGYDHFGIVAFAAAAALFLSAWRTPLTNPGRHLPPRRTMLLLASTAALRALAQLLDINVLGALLLCVDVYTLAHLARLGERRFAVSPLYLAGLFCFCLPIEPIVQRLLGFPLQLVSAQLACAALEPWFADLVCQGVRIRLNHTDVLVDLPCSGSELLSITGMIFLGLAAVGRPDLPHALRGACLALAGALIANGLRIAVLAMGIAFAPRLPIDVMDPVPHTLIGLLTIAMLIRALLGWFRRIEPVVTHPAADSTDTPRRPVLHFTFACLFCTCAVLTGFISAQPADASRPLPAPAAPLYAGGFAATAVALSEQERAYFTTFGGNATRASYGPYGLLLVSTTSPLRHLHDPAICLRGMGFHVKLLGTDHDTVSTAYRATLNGQAYLVHVSYQADDARQASSIAEVVWHWLRAPSQRWTMVQRIEPLGPDVDDHATQQWHAAIRRAFNLA